MIKYSIIIPVYNAEMRLEKLLLNLNNINRDDIEILFINDGSTDSSYNILNEFKFKNKKIINQTNHGVSYSRNEGIRNANGKYIMFIDCDDLIDVKIFEKIDQILEKREYPVIKFGFYFYSKDGNRTFYIEDDDCELKKDEVLYKLYSTNKYNSVWNQIINREIITSNNITFSVDKKNAEDFEFNKLLYNVCNVIYVIKDCYYFYYINENGTTRNLSKSNVTKCFNDIINIYCKVIYDINSFTPSEQLEILKRLYSEVEGGVRRLFLIEGIKSKEIKNLLKNMYENEDYKKLEIEIKKIKNNLNILQKLICSHKIIHYIGFILFIKKFK